MTFPVGEVDLVTLWVELLREVLADDESVFEDPPNADRMLDHVLLKNPGLAVVVVGGAGVVVVVTAAAAVFVPAGGEPGAWRH